VGEAAAFQDGTAAAFFPRRFCLLQGHSHFAHAPSFIILEWQNPEPLFRLSDEA